MEAKVDKESLELKVKAIYRNVALNPHKKYHFEMGRELAEKLGYNPNDLDNIPQKAVESFAGVGNPFYYADLKEGESVLDLGSGSGMDTFIAAIKVGSSGRVCGIDFSSEQLEKGETLRRDAKLDHVEFYDAFIEALPFEDNSFDVVISNGVINLSAEKQDVFKEIARVLKPDGRLAVSDIVSDKHLTMKIKCDADLWASCIGGATQLDDYREMIEKTGLRIINLHENSDYKFLSKSAIGASEEYGVKSVSYLATKM